MTPLVIIGTGGHARELHAIVEALENQAPDEFSMVGWLDSNTAQHGQQVHGLPVRGGLEWLQGHPEVEVVVGIGAPAVRRRVTRQVQALGHERFATLVHPSAVVGQRVKLGAGAVVCPGVIVTADAQLGAHVHLNTGCVVTHDDVLGDFSTVSPRAVVAGNVILGEGVEVGMNASIIQGRRIGAWSVIGAQGCVIDDLPANVIAVGAPAKVIKERAVGWQDQLTPLPARRIDRMGT